MNVNNRQKNRLEAIERELEIVETGSQEEAELIQEKNDILLDQERQAAEERIELKEEEAEKIKEIETALFQFLRNQLDAYYEEKFEKIDEDIAASEEAEDKLIEAQERGVANTEESIAFERQQQAELEAERQRLAEQQARRELVLASIESYRANDGDLQKTITDIIALREFANTVPLFFEGTEDTGEGSRRKD